MEYVIGNPSKSSDAEKFNIVLELSVFPRLTLREPSNTVVDASAESNVIVSLGPEKIRSYSLPS